MKQTVRISATRCVLLMLLGCGFVLSGLLVVQFLHAWHPVTIAVVLYLLGSAIAAESRLRLAAGIRGGLYPLTEIIDLRTMADSAGWTAIGLVISLGFLIAYRQFSYGSDSWAWTWMILALVFTSGQLPATLRTPYNNPRAAIQYPKMSWKTGWLPIAGGVAWMLSWPSVAFDARWHSLFLMLAILAIGGTWFKASRITWPQPADNPPIANSQIFTSQS